MKRVISLLLLSLFVIIAVSLISRPAATVAVLVQADSVESATAIVRAHGGRVHEQLPIIAAVSADVPINSIAAITSNPQIRQVYHDKETAAAGGAPTVYFPQVAGADQVWDQGVDGSGITVAVVDSGIDYPGVLSRVIARYDALDNPSAPHKDLYGHGSFIAGIIGNDRQDDNGAVGVAPGVSFVDVRVLDDEGKGTSTDVVEGLNWILNNHAQYNIRIVNLSLISQVDSPYWADPINQAVESLWAAGIVVVAAAGNDGPGPMTIAVPGNDPFIVTAGAFTDNFTPENESDDYVTPFSGAGPTEMGFVKPDVIAPGAHVISSMKPNTTWADSNPDSRVQGTYYRAAGTSTAAAVTSGVVALMLDNNPSLTPDQVKYRLIVSSRPAAYDDGDLTWSILQQGAGRVWTPDAVLGSYTGEANSGMTPGGLYVGPVVYRDGIFQLVEEDGDPLPGAGGYS
ncbi:MAG: S8 family peptidase, partial [Chloroflexi bacterium]|nr:S8 family peptidase [Chloroflexota bacterium]